MTDTPHAERAHSKLSPSSASRWMNCPGSINLIGDAEGSSSVFAREGTAAHELASVLLQNGRAAVFYSGWVIDSESGVMLPPKEGKADNDTRFEVTDEMQEAVDIYVRAVRTCKNKHGGEMIVEERLDLSHIAPDTSGTCDAAVYVPKTKSLHVFDLKYGKGVIVSPRDNPQALMYTSGMVKRLHNRGIEKVTMYIAQPRTPGDPIKAWDIDPVWLLDWERECADAAKATNNPEAELVPGTWCKFCPAAAKCPALHQAALDVAQIEFGAETPTMPDPTNYSPEELAGKLAQIPLLKDYMKAVEEFAHAEAMHGRPIPGFKLVAKRASRKWRDEDALLKTCELLGLEAFDEPKLLSPAQLEKQIPRKDRKLLDPLVIKSSSGTILVDKNDPREAAAVDAVSEFAGNAIEIGD